MKTEEERNIINAEAETTKKELMPEQLNWISGGAERFIPQPQSFSGDDVVFRATQELGKPYAWAAVGPNAYDCSGFVSYCLTGIHARLGTTSTFMGWPRVSNPMPGDICTNSSHCGIYIAPGSMIHAPGFGSVISYGGIPGDMIIVRMP